MRLIQEDLPINPLIRHQNPTENAQIAYEIANLIRCFAPQLGAKQERNISDCYQRLAEPDFTSLELELQTQARLVGIAPRCFPENFIRNQAMISRTLVLPPLPGQLLVRRQNRVAAGICHQEADNAGFDVNGFHGLSAQHFDCALDGGQGGFHFGGRVRQVEREANHLP